MTSEGKRGRPTRPESYLFPVPMAVVLGFAGAAGAIVFRIRTGDRLVLADPRRAVDHLDRLRSLTAWCQPPPR